MKIWFARVIPVLVGVVLATVPSAAQQPAPDTDVYHVHMVKALPGQAAALGKELLAGDPAAPMPGHFVVLRHQEGDDWDYCVIEHLGAKATVAVTPAPPASETPLRAWHTDTFVSGPSWSTVTQALGTGTGAVFAVGVYRAAPGHRSQLEASLRQPGSPSSKVTTGALMFQHLEGGDWQFLTVTRYNSWQDFATDRMEAAASPSAAGGWADVRQHIDFHRDTIADRLAAK